MCGCGLTSIDGLSRLPKLWILELNDNRLEDLEALRTAELTKLKRLSLSGNRFVSLESLEPLGSLGALEEVELVNSPVVELDGFVAGVFAIAPQLQFLNGYDADGNKNPDPTARDGIDDEEDEGHAWGEDESDGELSYGDDDDELTLFPPIAPIDPADATANAARSAAFAMALHPRLGAQSPARHLSVELVRHVCELLKLMSARRLAAVHVRTSPVLLDQTPGTMITRLEWHYTNHAPHTCGSAPGVWAPPLLLRPSESLTKIELFTGPFKGDAAAEYDERPRTFGPPSLTFARPL